MALKTNGTVWTWGVNVSGQLGNNSTTRELTAVNIGLTDIVAIAAGSAHAVALASDGTVWVWGLNVNGQLGNGTNTNALVPQAVGAFGTASAIAAGDRHTLVVRSNGTVWGAGKNVNGQLGDGSTTERWTPVQMSGISSATAAAAGFGHSVVLLSDGTVRASGYNASGQIGDNSTTQRTTPVTVSGLTGVAAINAGYWFSNALKSNGSVWSWGYNFDGQIGDGGSADRKVPTETSGLTSITELAAGHFHALSASGTGVVSTWGWNEQGMLGDGTTTLRRTPVAISGANYAWNITLLTLSPAPGVYTVAQTVTIATITPGTTIHYTLDGSVPDASSPTYTGPLNVAHTTTVSAIALRDGWTSSPVASGTYTMNFGTLPTPAISPAGGTFTSSATVTLSVQADATIRYTLDGSTPTASSAVYSAPLTVLTTATLKARAFHPDYTTSSTASADFTILVAAPTFTPGSGNYPAGQSIGVATSTPGATITYTLDGSDPVETGPSVPVSGTITAGNYTLKARAWKAGCTPSDIVSATYTVTGSMAGAAVAGGGWHSLAVNTDGSVWAWGLNSSLQIGDGSTTQRTVAARVAGLTGITAIAAGGVHSLAIDNAGNVWAWGGNYDGQVGDDTTINRAIPVNVSGVSDVTGLAAGSRHSIAVRSDGTAWSWGYNANGRLGDGSTTTRLAPVQVSGLSTVAAVAAGQEHTIAIRTDGTVWSWGRNNSGALGDGTTTDRLAPVAVTGVSGITRIAAGEAFSLALKSDGTVWSWGENDFGRLGDGTTVDKHTPQQIAGLTGMTRIAAGWRHGLALKGDGTLWAWGSNTNGQLGDGTTIDRWTPIQVPGVSEIVGIAAGEEHSLAVAADGRIWTWGRNTTGALGDGTTTTRSQPRLISGAGMIWNAPPPAIQLGSGLYFSEQSAPVTAVDTTATLHYTLDGTFPQTTDPTVASGSTVAITRSRTLTVAAFKTGAPPSIPAIATYELKVPTPSITPASGAYGGPQSITFSSGISSTSFTYTLDGREPTISSTGYIGPFSIGGSMTVKAAAHREGWTSSNAAYASYWISAGVVDPPTITPPSGTYAGERVISLSTAVAGASVRFTTDGSEPTQASLLYVRPFVVSTSLTVKAKVFKGGYGPSTTTTAAYVIDGPNLTAVPTIAPSGGRFLTSQLVTITGPPTATLRYTTNGADPTESDTTIASGGTLLIDRSLVLKVRAWQTGAQPSIVRRADFVITGAIAAGEHVSVALKADGTVWTWGDNAFGALGDGLTADRNTPAQVFSGTIRIAAGVRHTLALKADGTVWAWGENFAGELGDGTTTMRRTPVQVQSLTGVVAIAAGFAYSLALKSDGTVWAWGNNWAGQLGDNTTTPRLLPVQVVGISGVTAIAARDVSSFALATDGATSGRLWSWGYNAGRQLGDESTINKLVPVSAVVPLLDSVRAGFDWAGGREANGTVWLWGKNTVGQLGKGVTSESENPSTLAAPWIPAGILLGGGWGHVLLIDRDRARWGWGANAFAQTGTGSGADVLVPTFASVPQGIQASDGGMNHSIGLRADGWISAWGGGGQGQLGNGSNGNTSVPVTVTGLRLVENDWLLSDSDADGLLTWREYELGSDPLNADTNGDFVPDGVEVLAGSDLANVDLDGDALSTRAELSLGTDALRNDTDGDGVVDGLDAFPLDSSRSALPPPDVNDQTAPVITLIEPAGAIPIL